MVTLMTKFPKVVDNSYNIQYTQQARILLLDIHA
jgi:hypothetical protein